MSRLPSDFFLWLLHSVIAISFRHKDYHFLPENTHACYNETNISGAIIACLIAALGLPEYHFVIYPFFYNHIPSMLRRIGLGMLLMATSFLCDSIIEVVGHMENGNVTCMFSTNSEEGGHFPINYLWTLIPNLIHATGFVLVFYSSFEFVIAQTPWQMKELSVSVLLEFLGIFFIVGELIVNIFISFPFNVFPSCGFYYHMTFFATTLVILFVFVLISKWYTLRKRDDVVPYNRLAEDYFEKNYYLENRYMKQCNFH